MYLCNTWCGEMVERGGGGRGRKRGDMEQRELLLPTLYELSF